MVGDASTKVKHLLFISEEENQAPPKEIQKISVNSLNEHKFCGIIIPNRCLLGGYIWNI